MKNLIKLGTIGVIASIVFSSCGTSNIAITKRHYNKGYYVERSSSNVAPYIKGGATQPVTKPLYAMQTQAKQSTHVVNTIQVARANNTFIVANTPHKNATQSRVVEIIKYPAAIIEAPASQITMAVASITKVQDGDHAERAALSLFWLVIVVILILWLIGLLSGGWGLGGLINLLLVVALILLILWLLRII
jgi:hypothetical protein